MQTKRIRKKKRRVMKFNEELLHSMADNENFEWTDAFTGAVLTGDGPVQQQQSNNHVVRSTASWRVPHSSRVPQSLRSVPFQV